MPPDDIDPTNPPTPPAPPAPTPPAGGQVSLDQYNGLKGTVKQLQNQLQAKQGEIDGFNARIAELESKLTDAGKGLGELNELKALKTDLEAKLAGQSGLNTRLKTAMKFPQLLGDEVQAIVDNWAGDAEGLEKVLSGMAAKIGQSAPPPVTPPPPVPPKPPEAGAADYNDLMRQANEALLAGKTAEFDRLSRLALAARDQKEGAFRPPVGKRLTADTAPAK